jgi:aminoglycoside phosphotransferase (APT) family kinase protein
MSYFDRTAMLVATNERDEIDAFRTSAAVQLGLAARPEVTEWRSATEGMSDDTIIVTLDDGIRGHELVIRRHRPVGVLRDQTDPARHFEILRALEHTPVPAPRALWFESDPSVLGGSFFVMERLPGKAVVPWSTRGRAFLAEAGDGDLGRQFVEILAGIHAVDLSEPGIAAVLPVGETPGEAVERVAGRVNALKWEPEPILADAIGWMRANLPCSARHTLVHGDYRTGNMLFDGDRISGVLDWEFARCGDPMWDLGWACASANQMDSGLVCYLMPEARFLDLYEEASGVALDRDALPFWKLLAAVSNASGWLECVEVFRAGRGLLFARMSYTVPVVRRLIAEALDYP